MRRPLHSHFFESEPCIGCAKETLNRSMKTLTGTEKDEFAYKDAVWSYLLEHSDLPRISVFNVDRLMQNQAALASVALSSRSTFSIEKRNAESLPMRRAMRL